MNSNSSRYKKINSLFYVLSGLLLSIVIAIFFLLLGSLIYKGHAFINLDFLASFPSRFSERAGILPGLVGSILVCVLAIIIAIPFGVFTGVYLSEYKRKNYFSFVLQTIITNLSGVPSIVYGVVSLGIFVYFFRLGHSIISAAFTLSLLAMPIIIVSTYESLRLVPDSIREAAYSLGASKRQAIIHHLLPYSITGVTTGVFFSFSRILGETAPLIAVGALTFVTFLPEVMITGSFPYIDFGWAKDPYTVVPIQIFNWVSRPDTSFHSNAAAACLILLAVTLTISGLALYLRRKIQKKVNW
jgi:phosphate transport system permease protein